MSGSVVIDGRDDRVVLRLDGRLDAEAAQVLLRAAAAAAACAAKRLEIDMRAVDSYTPEGVLGITGCRRLARHVPGGVAFLVAGGTSNGALLASLAEAP